MYKHLVGTMQYADNIMADATSESEVNQESVALELQADCYAGVWANRSAQQNLILESGDLEEALNAASAAGDDRLQRESQGYVVPDSFTHGTSAQRVEWFSRGFESGKMASCDCNCPELPAIG